MNLKTENQLSSYPLFAKEGKPQGRGVLKRRLRFPHLPIHLFTGLMFFALLTAALPAWAATPQIAAGVYHTVVIKSDGTLWAWGWNGTGRLGDGTTIDKSSPIQIGTDNKWVSVAAGSAHTVALKSDGTLWAWGRNWEGQLGDGTTIDKYSPVQIGTDNKWTVVVAGGYLS